jgi:REP element-mobilizing transposase RayT
MDGDPNVVSLVTFRMKWVKGIYAPPSSHIDAPSALHHIIIRGIEQKRIFENDKDREDFLERLSGLLKETMTPCFAWALTTNHVHLLLRAGTVPVASIMRRLLTGYAVRLLLCRIRATYSRNERPFFHPNVLGLYIVARMPYTPAS